MATTPDPQHNERLVISLILVIVAVLLLVRGWHTAPAAPAAPVATTTPAPTTPVTMPTPSASPAVHQTIAVPARRTGSNTIARCEPKWVFTGHIYQELVFVLYTDGSAVDIATQVTAAQPHPVAIACSLG